MITRYLLVTYALNSDVRIVKEKFRSEEHLNDFLDDEFEIYKNISVLTPKQFKKLKEEIKKIE